jgi:hypothetical protein
MDELTDGRTDGHTDGQTDRQTGWANVYGTNDMGMHYKTFVIVSS